MIPVNLAGPRQGQSIDWAVDWTGTSPIPLPCPLPTLPCRAFGRFHVYDLLARVDRLDFVLHCG